MATPSGPVDLEAKPGFLHHQCLETPGQLGSSHPIAAGLRLPLRPFHPGSQAPDLTLDLMLAINELPTVHEGIIAYPLPAARWLLNSLQPDIARSEAS
jgi:hypothetical protein